MSSTPYDELLEGLRRALDDSAAGGGAQFLAEQLAQIRFEIETIKDTQRAFMAALRARDVVARDHLAAKLPSPAPFIELNARDSFDSGEGFLGIEWDGQVPHRWTGPGQDATVKIWLDRSIPVFAEIVIHSYGDPGNQGEIKIFADGVELKAEEVEDKLLRTESFPVLDGALYTEIVIHVPWLSGVEENPEPQSPKRSRKKTSKSAGKSDSAAGGVNGPRGISFTHLRILAPT